MIEMVVYRQILKVKTTGSRATRNLRPEISDRLPEGLNYAVHEYNEEEDWCILEAWCSDHPVLPQKHRKNDTHLKKLSGDSAVIASLTSHPLSPPILGRMTTSTHDSVDETKKEITVHGRKGTYLRKIKETRKDMGTEEDIWVLDEG